MDFLLWIHFYFALMNRLIVLTGVPGSGKSYFARNLKAHNPEHVHIISSDELRKELLGSQQNLSNEPLIWQTFYQRVKDFSKYQNDIIILDATQAKKEYRVNNIKPFVPLYDEIDLICFLLDKVLVLKQNKEREFPIPEDALIKLIDEFELPDEDEKEFYNHLDIINSHDVDEIVKRYL